MASFGRRKTSGFLILDRSEQRQLNANQPSPLAVVPSLQAAASARGRGCRVSPPNGRQLDSLAVCDGVHVIMTDLEEVDHVQAPGDLVRQVDQRVAVLGQRALPVLG